MFHPASSRLHTSLKSSALARQRRVLAYKMRPMCGVQSARVRQMEKEIDEGAGGGMECKTCVPSGSSARLSRREERRERTRGKRKERRRGASPSLLHCSPRMPAVISGRMFMWLGRSSGSRRGVYRLIIVSLLHGYHHHLTCDCVLARRESTVHRSIISG